MTLTFNLSQAACDFFSRTHKGKKITQVQAAPPLGQVGGGDLHLDADQWLVHAANVQRKNVLLVIHLKTRYCMLFFDMKKADVDGFLRVFIDRWTTGVMDLAMEYEALDLIAPQIPEHLSNQLRRSFRLIQRGDRSGQTHLNEVLRFFKWDAEDFDFVNQPWSPLRYDTGINRTPRSIKGQKDYFYPHEEMLAHWLVTLAGVSVSEAEQVRKRYRPSSHANID